MITTCFMKEAIGVAALVTGERKLRELATCSDLCDEKEVLSTGCLYVKHASNCLRGA